MLVLPADPQWQADAPPPASIQEFRRHVAERLGNAWEVTLTAYDNDASTDLVGISASLQACHGNLLVSIARHAGSDAVMIGLRGVDPSIPFEDIAVAKGRMAEADVLARALLDPLEHWPLVTLDQTLGLLDEWRDELPTQLVNPEFVGILKGIAAKFAGKAVRELTFDLTPAKPPSPGTS